MSPLWSLDTKVYERVRGWCGPTVLKEGDEVLAADPTTSLWSWSRVERVEVSLREEALVAITPKGLDLKLGKRALLWWKDRGGNCRSSTYDSTHVKAFVLVSLPASASQPYASLNDDHLELAAWCLTDGWLQRAGSSAAWYVAQREQKMPRVVACAARLGFTPKLTERKRNVTHIMGKKLKSVSRSFELRFPAAQTREMLAWLPSKALPQWAWELDQRQFDHFLWSLVEGDGSRYAHTTTATVLYGTRAFLESFQAVCLVHGWNASMYEERAGAWRLNLSRQCTYQLPSEGRGEAAGAGLTWGVSIGHPALWVQRNGRPALVASLSTAPSVRPPRRQMSADVRRRISESKKGAKPPRHVMEALRAANVGRSLTREHRAALSRGLRKTWLTDLVRAPDGRVLQVENAREFSEQHGLRAAVLSRLLLGKVTSTQGWTRAEASK